MATPKATEAKQQAAVSASQDPNSSITAKDAEKTIMDEARKSGAAVYEFDPNSSPEEKRAQISSQAPSIGRPNLKAQAATALVSDADPGPPQYDMPPPAKLGAIDTKGEQDKNASLAVPSSAEAEDDDDFWSRVGWKPRFGDGIPEGLDMNVNLSDQATWLEERLQDKFFGDWYYNAGVIIFASLASWVVATLGGGLGWVFLIMATCGTYYRTSIRRVRRNFRDDIKREMAKAKLETDTEPLEWINSFLVKFWPIYAPVLAKTIVASVDQVLSVATPPMIESLKMTKFILGTKPPRLEHVKTYPKMEDDTVVMDWKFSFNPNDTADMTYRQLKVKQNPKVVLEVRLGKGIVSKGLDVIVEDMACEGIMRVKVKLQFDYPHIERVEICFTEKPTIDYVCKPLGGDTFGFDINFIPGLEGFILEQIHGNLGPMMYSPNVFPIEIAKMLAGAPIDQAMGVVQVTFHHAQGLKNPDQFSGVVDPYATVRINDRVDLGRTKTIKENANPHWNETVNILVGSLKDTLNLHVYDFNEFRKDRELGAAVFPMDRFEELEEHENEQLELSYNGKARGGIACDLRFFPVLEGTKLEDGTVEPPPETMTGIARFTVEQAKDLDGQKSLIGLLNPYAVLLLNGKEFHLSEKLKRVNSPVWTKASKEVLITDRRTAVLGLLIKDDRELASDPVIAKYTIKVDDLLDANAKGKEWFDLANTKTGRVKLKLTWRPVNLKGAFGGSGGYMKPIGVMRIYCKNARELKNLETVGKSDPYVRALLSGVQRARTVTWKNNLNPDFDEVLYVPVHTPREKLTLEVMDEESMGRDRSLGHFEVPIQDFIERGETGEYIVNHSQKMVAQTLSLGTGRSPKGTLNYTCSFFPTILTADPDEEERERELAEQQVGAPRLSSESLKTAPESPRPGTAESGRNSTEKMTRARTNTGASQLSMGTVGTAGKGSVKESIPEVPKITINADNLIDYESGLLIFQLVDGNFQRTNCHLEVIIDDHVFPSHSSAKVKTKQFEFNETGDAMIRELDQSRITLRLVQHVDRGDSSGNETLAKLSGPTLQTLQRCLYTATPLVLRDDHGTESTVTVKLKFIPIKMKLDPSESFRNMGQLRVDVVEASGLPAADRNGYSDPYCKFILNEKEVHKTERKNKTLNPQWNETFETAVRSRTAAKMEVHVFDWDMAASDDFLGKATIDLAAIEPYMRREINLPLSGEKGDKAGSIKLRLLFTPDWISRTRQGSSTFHGTFNVAGKVAGAPVKGATKVVGGVGGGVVKGASFLGKSFRRRKSRAGSDFDPNNMEEDQNGTPPPMPTGANLADYDSPQPPATPHSRNVSMAASPNGATSPNGSAGADSGFAHISVIGTSGFPPAANVRVVLKLATGRELIKTKAIRAPSGEVKFDGESSRFASGPDAALRVLVQGHHTLGRDDDLGEGLVSLAELGSETVVKMSKGEGKVVLSGGWEAADSASLAPSKLGRFARHGREKTPA
ncbi:tricalbin [Microthyrium microscopicum]|uniref:Tricalbin n=1 Tax=Microthyrium microscopicum TaxID=703497 RepID=A0A6A6UCP6_9PEZI|nr:tricalbin [Microthyrium microscopicum]